MRLVKGANLAMEKVEAIMHGWEQAPYTAKADVDANYLRCVERALRPDAVGALRIGVASHNLYDVAAAHLLATDRGAQESLDIEMLQGMSPAQARAVRDEVGTVILYTPVVAPEDFDAAVSYLVRRLEESASPRTTSTPSSPRTPPRSPTRRPASGRASRPSAAPQSARAAPPSARRSVTPSTTPPTPTPPCPGTVRGPLAPSSRLGRSRPPRT